MNEADATAARSPFPASPWHPPALSAEQLALLLELGLVDLALGEALIKDVEGGAAVAGAAATWAPTMDMVEAVATYVLRCLFRTKEKYITAKVASNTPPTIKIKVVTIAQFSSAGPYKCPSS